VRLNALYTSAQGEGPDLGRLTTFVRTARCNLRCAWCDSTETFKGGVDTPVAEIVARVAAAPARAVAITGGEPMLDKDTPALADALIKLGYDVSVWTNGTASLCDLDDSVRKIVDPKPPSACADASGRGRDQTLWSHLRKSLGRDDVLKFVLRNEVDYAWAIGKCLEHSLLWRAREGLRRPIGRPEIWLSAAHGELSAARVVEWMLRDRVEARLNVQAHKIWGVE
jgi:7-carboxy-7-deazaguanine synthase